MSLIQSRNKAFTLAEVLIALALLGVVAAFAIPKVLETTQDQDRKAKFKDTYGALSEALYAGVLKGEITSLTTVSYISEKLNAVNVCDNAQTKGCYPGAHTAPNVSPVAAGMVLHNGVMLFDMEDQAQGAFYDGFWLDLNGKNDPNQNCVDQIPLMIIYRNNATYGLKAGTVTIYSTAMDIAIGGTGAAGCSPTVFNTLME